MPCLVISPFSRGGHIANETFDHTSQLKLVAERFGVEVPNLSTWRDQTVGDLTSALFAGTYTTTVPALPAPTLPAQELTGDCSLVNQDTESGGASPSVPSNQTMPNQQGGTTPASDYYTTSGGDAGSDPSSDVGSGRRIVVEPAGRRRMTTKSSYNRLARVTR